MKKYLLLCILAVSCGTSKKKVDDKPAQNPPVAQPIEDPKTPDTEPEAEAKVINAFWESASGRWLGNCVTNEEKKSSFMPGVELTKEELRLLSFNFPDNNINCWGGANQADGAPLVYTIKAASADKDGWLLLRTSCVGYRCARLDQNFLVKLDKFLSIRRLMPDGGLEESLVFPTGPSK